MNASLDAIHVYVDGSSSPKTDHAAYGWIVANPQGSMAPARAVAVPNPGKSTRLATAMEAAAFIDAVWEFAPRNRHIVVHGDCTALSIMIEKYRASGNTDVFFSSKALREEDAWKLLPLLNSVSFEFQWVKGHSGNFHNAVADQMLRIITAAGRSEAEAVNFATSALNNGVARVWGVVRSKRGAIIGSGYETVCA